MKRLWETNQEPKLIYVKVTSKKPQDIVLSVADAEKPETFYSKQVFRLHGTEIFEISLPITPKKAFFEITALADKKAQAVMPWFAPGEDSTIEYSIKQVPFLKNTKCDSRYANNQQLREFLNFTGWFSENASVLDAGKNVAPYYSAGGQFKVSYLPYIMDDLEYLVVDGQVVKNPNFGKINPTSYRVHSTTKEMELAKNFVIDYSIPQRMVLFTHEYAHGYENQNPSDEFEADYHSVNICRGCLGFGKRELGTAYAKVFMRYPSTENAQRIIAIKKQLENMP